MIAGLVVLLLLPAARYGWDGNLQLLGDWWQTVTTTTAPNLTNPDNVSLSAMFTKWLGPGFAGPRSLAAASGGDPAAPHRPSSSPAAASCRRPDTLEGSLLLLLIPLLSPQGWDYVFLIGDAGGDAADQRAAVAAARAALRDDRVDRVVALSIFDLMGRSAYSHVHAAVAHHGIRARRGRGAHRAAVPEGGLT